MAYCDVAESSVVHPNRSAWTKKGECQLIDAKRGTIFPLRSQGFR